MMAIAHNIASQFTNRQLNITTNRKGKSAEKLSSGYRINRSADGALNETHSVLQRMRELSVQAANDTNTEADRNAI